MVRHWFATLVLLTAVLAGCTEPLSDAFPDADVRHHGKLAAGDSDSALHRYEFELPAGKGGMKVCTGYDFDAAHRMAILATFLDDQGDRWGPAGASSHEPRCNQEMTKLQPGIYALEVTTSGKGEYIVGLYFL